MDRAEVRLAVGFFSGTLRIMLLLFVGGTFCLICTIVQGKETLSE
jgi:hypothetical protein